MRPRMPKRVIVMTDGVKNCPMEIALAANKIRQRRMTEVYAIGVGSRCQPGQTHGCYLYEELKLISSKPQDKFILEVDNFAQLKSLKTKLLS